MKSIVLLAITITISIFGQSQAIEQLVYEIRNPQTDSAHFRRALETIGEYLALQALEELETREMSIQTLTGAEAKHPLLSETPVLVTILRAGLPLNAGVQRVFPNAEVGFLGMARNEKTLKAEISYAALPDVANRCVIITDTMLATGGSLLDAIHLIEQGNPKKIILIAAIASQPGVDRILRYNPEIKIYSAAIDPALNDKGYIIPGLGDAGDRAFGEKKGAPQSSPDIDVVLQARLAQNEAIQAGDIDRIAAFWTEDVSLCTGRGSSSVGKSAYRSLFETNALGETLIYVRTPETIEISSGFPLAFESGTWTAHQKDPNTSPLFSGRYCAQWIKDKESWLIRSEIFVALHSNKVQR